MRLTVAGETPRVSALDLPAERRGALARQVEDAQRALSRVRYGQVFRVGAARCVLNPDSPLSTDNTAGTLQGQPSQLESTLHRLPVVFAEAGRPEVVVVDSPSCAPELGVVAEESGYEAVDETAVLLLTRPARLAEGEPGRLAVPVAGADEEALPRLLEETTGARGRLGRQLAVLAGHRLDDPRYRAFAVRQRGELAGVGGAFVDSGLGLVVDLLVRPGARRRGIGRALASAAAADCLVRGAALVCATGETRGPGERFWTGLGFEPAYDVVTYSLAC